MKKRTGRGLGVDTGQNAVKRGKKGQDEPSVRPDRLRGGKRENKARVEISAGGVVYRRTPRGVRVALILDPFGKWTFAKGHVEAGETVRQAAVRETKEEMGLKDVRIETPLGKIDFWFRDRYRPETRGVMVHKHVHYFLMEAAPDAKGRPQKKERIRRIVWIAPGRLAKMSSYDDVKSVVDKAKAILCGKSGRRGERSERSGRRGRRGSGAEQHATAPLVSSARHTKDE